MEVRLHHGVDLFAADAVVLIEHLSTNVRGQLTSSFSNGRTRLQRKGGGHKVELGLPAED